MGGRSLVAALQGRVWRAQAQQHMVLVQELNLQVPVVVLSEFWSSCPKHWVEEQQDPRYGFPWVGR